MSPRNFAFPIALQFCCITWSSFLCNRHRLQLHWVLRGPFPVAQSHLLLAAHLGVSQWTLATVTAITCKFAWRSHNNIVPDLGRFDAWHLSHLNVPNTSHATCADVTTACVLCITLLAWPRMFLLHRRWARQVCPSLVTPLVGRQNPCISHSTTTPSTHSIVRSSQ